jgi:hypothetical protein
MFQPAAVAAAASNATSVVVTVTALGVTGVGTSARAAGRLNGRFT